MLIGVDEHKKKVNPSFIFLRKLVLSRKIILIIPIIIKEIPAYLVRQDKATESDAITN